MSDYERIKRLTIASLQMASDIFEMKAEQSRLMASETGQSEREAGLQEGRAEAFDVARRYLEPILAAIEGE